ncbi:MAG: SUMF1/EgtB/PvdO family nonheme iron enzyme [Nitrospinae bacterium]|nr:SUMF1/EgtB/PvdO family nonheme iron enzyme [Nitrospinota bacterium]
MIEKKKQKIAIIDFSDLNGNVTALGQFMAEELTTQLFIIAPGKFEVVKRRQLLKLEEELVLGKVGNIEEKGIKKMGQVFGVDAVVTGSMTDLGNTVKINARVIAVESAKIFAVAATDIPKTGMVADLIEKKVEGRQPVEKATTPLTTLTKPTKEKEWAKTEMTQKQITAEGGIFKDPGTVIEFIFVKGGCFHMGDTFGDGSSDEYPVHKVCLDDFYIGKYEVTQIEWLEVMERNPSSRRACDDCPVEMVSWNNVQEYIKRLNRKTGREYRLPTEAEWEYAARSGGKKEKYAGGNDLDSVGWDSDNSRGKTYPAGQKNPNGLGIYDMSGNVWEWCQDWSDENYYKSSPRDNPKGAGSGQTRIIRGGSWNYDESISRAANRGWDIPDSRRSDIGFRVARTK